MKPFLNYYGSKTTMTGTLLSYFPLDYKTYLEPFGGGASMLFEKDPHGMEVYNDIEENVWSVFKVIQDEDMFKRFQQRCTLALYSRDLYNEAKQALKTDLDIEDRAYYFFLLSRMSFNGNGGFSVCKESRRGMVKNVSDFLSKVDMLPEYHNRLRRVLIEHKDAMELLDDYNEKGTFAYCDPPYVHDTRKSASGYIHEMEDDEHEKFIEKCLTFKGKLLISGYDNQMYDRLVENGFEKIHFESPNAHSDSIETLWRNYKTWY